MVTSPNISATIEAVHTEAAALATFLKELDPTDWSRETACPEWEVGDVVAHLSQGATTWTELLRRALAGDASAPPGQAALRPGDRGSEASAQRAIEQRQNQTPRELLAYYITGYELLDQVLREIKPQDWERPCFHRRGVVTIRDMVARRVQELAIHGWDIHSRFDAGHQLSEASVPVIVTLAHLWLANAFCPNAHSATPVRYRFEIAGPSPVWEDVVVYPDRIEIDNIGVEPANVTIKGSANDYLLLIYGRIKMADPDIADRFEIDGPRERAELFGSWFPGV